MSTYVLDQFALMYHVICDNICAAAETRLKLKEDSVLSCKH